MKQALAVLGVVLSASAVQCSKAGAPASAGAEPESAFRTTLKDGDEVFAVEPELVFGVDYDTRERQVHAERASPRDAFSISVRDAQGRELSRCAAGPAWGSVVPALSSLRALKVLAPSDARSLWLSQGARVATLRVRDAMSAEPSEFRVVARASDVVVRDGGGVFVSSLSPSVVALLERGCTGS
ncbi:MAG: hypothetical protein QM756_24770 [Polyangiaceae bacterium]